MGPDLYFLKMPVNISQYCGTVALFNSRSIVNRSKVNSFVTSNYRNNTYIACSLVFVNNILSFLTLFNVLFFLKDNVSKNNKQFLVSILFSSTILSIPFVLFFSLLVSLSGDAQNFAKLHVLKAYVTVHKFSIICLCETYLDSSIPFDDNNLEISGYNLIHSDQPSNSKSGGVCIYYKKFFL